MKAFDEDRKKQFMEAEHVHELCALCGFFVDAMLVTFVTYQQKGEKT